MLESFCKLLGKTGHHRNLAVRYFPAAPIRYSSYPPTKRSLGTPIKHDLYISRRYLLEYNCEAHATAIRAEHFATHEEAIVNHIHISSKGKEILIKLKKRTRDLTLEPALPIGAL